MVSVIIPIYNTGIYLHDCIASICKQTYKDLQIIMVDDGSLPDTAKMCDDIAMVDSRIQVIHKANEGVSIARNVGLAQAEGDIVCFVDSDDTIKPQMIESLASALEVNNAQIAICDAVTIRPGKPDEPDTITTLKQSCVLETKDMSADTLSQLAGSACRCAYKRTDTFLSEEARFPEGLKFSEDRIFNIIAMSKAKRIAYIKEPFYNRLIRSGSACFRYYPDMTEQIVEMREVLIPTVLKYWGPKYVQAYENQIAGHIRFAVTNYTAFGNGETIKGRLSKLKGLCSNESIQSCLHTIETNDCRSNAIMHGNYIMLYVLGCLTNIYHKIWKRGQYQA